MSESALPATYTRLRLIRSVKRRHLLFIALVAPAVILRIVTAVRPIVRSVQLGLTNRSIIGGTDEYVGVQNYSALINNSSFRDAVVFTLLFVLLSTLLQLVGGLLIALLLNTQFKGRMLARTLNLIPWAIPVIVAAYTFRWLLDDQFGMFPHIVSLLGGARPVVLISPLGAKITLILVNVWKNAPFMAVVFLAGLQGVPEELYDAAKVDGAGTARRFWSITLPLIAPLVITMGLFFIVFQLASFDLIFGLTNGGPGKATEVLSLRIFEEGILFLKYGVASSISVLLLLIVTLVGLLAVVLFRKFEVTF